MDRLAEVIPLPRPAESPVPLADRDDDDLMRLARGGRQEAFDALVRRHQSRVLRYCHKVLGGAVPLARDAAQSTFLELFRYLPRYQPRGTFVVFLQRLAVNQCRMLARSHRARERGAEVLGREPSPNSPLPDAELLKQERRREVERALDSLADKHREVLALRFTAELSLEEVSETLEIPLGTVKSRLFHALRLLRDQLGEETS